MNERLSDPPQGVLGRFISRDPIGFSGGLNLYAYTTNPVNYVDPSGLESIASGALPPGWTMTTQPDGVNAYSNQELNLVANIQYPPKPPKPMPTPPLSPTPVPPPILTGNVASGTASIRPCWDLDNLHPLNYPPSGVDIDTNMRRAQTVGKNMPDSSKFKWFKRMVQNGGPWDFKQQSGRFEPYGNYHYGAVGTAFGLNEEYLARMAGWAQHRAGTSKPEWGVPWGDAPYGDDPRDQRRIRQGCAYARSKGY